MECYRFWVVSALPVLMAHAVLSWLPPLLADFEWGKPLAG
jgi:hypothetical protein